MTRAFLGLGSNLGDRRALLSQAIEALDMGAVSVTGRSSVYETDPIGGPGGQPLFLNQVVAVETTLSARDLWKRCSAVEATLGRAREHEEPWGPRTIDIDLLLFGDEVIDDQDLCVPHPRLHERAFVLVPLVEVAPAVVVPGRGPAVEILAGLPESQGIRPSD